MMTFFAPASMWARAWSASVKRPVDSITRSTPRSAQGRLAGSFSSSTWTNLPLTVMPSRSAVMSASYGAVGGVVLEQVGEGFVLGQVIDRHDLEQVGEPALIDGLEDLAADAAETIDADLVHHAMLLD